MPRASRSRKTIRDDDDDDDEQEDVEQEHEEESEKEEEEEEMQVNDEENDEEEEDEELQDDEEEEEEERPRRRKGRKASKKKSTRSKKVVEDNEDDEEEEEEQENRGSNRQAKKKQKKKKNPKKPRTSVTAALANDEEEDEEEQDNDGGNGGNGGMQILSQMPDQSQDLPMARQSDRNNFMKLGIDARQKAISDLVRTILNKAMAGEPIHRQGIIKEAQIGNVRISSAAFEEANIVLQNTFDFKLVRVPAWMERTKDLPAKCKERYYLINALDDPNGDICKIVHGTHNVDAMEKGLLMVILSFIFCKGEPRSDGSRWLLDKELYRLLHSVDENIHAEPPAASSSRSHRPSSAATTGTPDVDAVIEKCVAMDYLIKVKASSGEHFMAMSQEVEESSYFYAIGPRAALEIGRLQIVHFCASILDQEPDPNMLAEIEQAEQEEEGEE